VAFIVDLMDGASTGDNAPRSCATGLARFIAALAAIEKAQFLAWSS
jgi:hypothetical protein